jgi:DNA-binding NarL/FixJ family response regulator
VIRTLVVDDHPAMLNGVVGALRSEPGIVPVATATGMQSALSAAEHHRPSVALVDYHLADGDGLQLCHCLKDRALPPGVLIYSAFKGPRLELAAALAGADGILDKGVSLDELFEAVRTVARGGRVFRPLSPGAVELAMPGLDPDDLPILAMRLDDTPIAEIARVLRVDEATVSQRLLGMLARLAR